MVVRWMRLRGHASQLLEIDDALMVAFLNMLPHRRIELDRPVIRAIIIHARPDAQVVDDVPGSQKEDASATKLLQVLPKFVMK